MRIKRQLTPVLSVLEEEWPKNALLQTGLLLSNFQCCESQDYARIIMDCLSVWEIHNVQCTSIQIVLLTAVVLVLYLQSYRVIVVINN